MTVVLGVTAVPKDAPQALLAQYGTINGFQWPRDSVIAAQVVYVPAHLVAEQRRQVWIAVMVVLAGGFAVTGLAISLLLRRNVIQPVERIAGMASRIATADLQESEPQSLAADAKRSDELGQLARVFQKMAAEVYAREQRFRQQVQELKISVDESRKAREVAEITETEYFQELQRKARTLRQRSGPPGGNSHHQDGEPADTEGLRCAFSLFGVSFASPRQAQPPPLGSPGSRAWRRARWSCMRRTARSPCRSPTSRRAPRAS